MANHKTGSQRYNDRIDKIFEYAKKSGTFDDKKVPYDSRSEAMKKAMNKKIRKAGKFNYSKGGKNI